jgi:integrase
MPRLSFAPSGSPTTPKYRHHRPTGQAVVTLNGHDIYLGKWNSRASRSEHDRRIAEWLASGRCLPQPDANLTIAELALRYWQFAGTYYTKNGRPTGSIPVIRVALRLLRQSYGPAPVAEFGPLALESIQVKMIGAGLSRNTINETIACIRRAFRWGVAKELVPPAVLQALQAVPGLRKGRTAAREPAPVQPVSDEIVEATLPHLSTVAADMIRLQRLLGCRPGEICIMRPCDIDRSGEVWTYRPASYKTEHHERERVIFIGPNAQQILLPYLLRDAQAFCFSPAESEIKRKATMRANRKTPVQPCQENRSRQHPKRKPGTKYNKDSYNHAIRRAVDKANRLRAESGEEPLPCWHPNQLRHAWGTEVRHQFGLEAAQVILGHAKADVTQVYAERDLERAKEIMRKIG